MEVKISFLNNKCEAFFNDPKRNKCLCGGFASGKTYTGCEIVIFLSLAFDNYRTLIARETYKNLLDTTYKTFLKICPPQAIASWDKNMGNMKLINGSEILWRHLDEFDDSMARGLEVNTIYIDQAEEVSEQIYDILDSRVGRWERARPNKELLKSKPDWPRDSFGNYIVPSYMLLTPNPDQETHWIWRKYHPDSPEYEAYCTTHAYYEVSSLENPYINQEILRTMLSRDPSWVKRFVYGQWGITDATIHSILPYSILDPPASWIEAMLAKSTLYRAMDHGETAPTCCLWLAATRDNNYIVYREYYMPGQLVSYHRQAITDLSKNEVYAVSVADPQIFKVTQQKYQQQWTVAQEYLDTNISAPPIVWLPADNNELGTRNRINELLAIDPANTHPLSGEKGAPRLYFIKRSKDHNYGVEHAINQTRQQRRKKLGEINGRPIYSDERLATVEDHAYDALRYLIAIHGRGPKAYKPRPAPTTFLGARDRYKMALVHSQLNPFGDRRAKI